MEKYTIKTAGHSALGVLQIAGGILLLAAGVVRFLTAEIWRRFNGEVPVFVWIVLAAMFATDIYLFYLGFMNFKMVKRCKRLVSLLSAQKEAISFSQAAEQLRRSRAGLFRDLTRMKKQRYFQNICVLEDCIVLENPRFAGALMIRADESKVFAERKRPVLGGEAIYEIKSKVASQAAEQPHVESDPMQELIGAGNDILKEIKDKEKSIANAKIRACTGDIAAAAEQMLVFAKGRPEKYLVVRQSVEYYLPTIRDLLSEYQELGSQAIKGNNILTSMDKIEASMSMAAENLKMELDGLYLDKMIDITVDIEVMENIMNEKWRV